LQSEAGWNALVKVCGNEFSSGFPPGIVGLCRESQVQNVGGLESGLEAREAAAYFLAVAQCLRDMRLVADLPIIGRNQFRKKLARALASALDDSATSEQALQAAARDWREIIAEIGPAKVRDSYRASLGLSPKPSRE
jgi:hypothetical protein